MIIFIYIINIIYSLFFGCNHGFGYKAPINISSIRHIETATNYQEIIQAITAFDNIISGNTKAAKDISPGTYSIVSHLLSDENKNMFNPFIYQTFKLLMEKKKEVTLKLHAIYEYIKDIKFLGLIFGSRGVKQFEYEYDEDKSNWYFIPSDDTNIPNNIINKFNNIQTINIRGTQAGYPSKYYSLSLFCLLSLLEPQSTIKQINISTSLDLPRDKTSWLKFVFLRDSFSLKQQYKKKGSIIDIDEYERTISINKK